MHRWGVGLVVALAACAAPEDDVDDTDVVDDTELDDTDDVDDTDVGPIVGASATVRVEELRAEAPLAGAIVLVHDGDGRTVAEHRTGADGEVDVVVPEGGAVSLLDAVGGAYQVETVFDVPADALVVFGVIPLYAPDETNQRGRPFRVTVSGSTAGVTGWWVGSVCDGLTTNSMANVELTNDACPQVLVEDVLVVGRNSQGLPVVAGRVADVEVGYDDVVEVPLSAVSARAFTLGVAGAPPDTSRASFTGSLRVGRVRSYNVSTTRYGETGSFTQALSFPDLANARFDLSVSLNAGRSSMDRTVADRNPPSTFTLDAGALARPAPWIDESVTVRPALRWSTTPGDRGVGAWGYLGWTSAEGGDGAWVPRFDPAVRDSVQVPELPERYARFRPPEGATFYGSSFVFTRPDWAGDYAAFLAVVGTPESSDVVRSSAN